MPGHRRERHRPKPTGWQIVESPLPVPGAKDIRACGDSPHEGIRQGIHATARPVEAGPRSAHDHDRRPIWEHARRLAREAAAR